MGTKQSTIDFIEDQLASLEKIRSRKMFGEYALYYGDKVVALVCDNTLFVKVTEQGRIFMGSYYREGIAYPKAKPSIEIDPDLLEDREWLCELIQITADSLPIPKKKP